MNKKKKNGSTKRGGRAKANCDTPQVQYLPGKQELESHGWKRESMMFSEI
jgi:hypothetical protein